jgi:hypothetical protein
MQDDDLQDGGGYDVDDWNRLQPFTGRVATLEDVEAKVAVFALADTTQPKTIDMPLPQPAIWWEDDGEQAVVIVQAETHLNDEGLPLEVVGLILPDGGSAVALLDDVDLVDDTDPTWISLVESAVDDADA